MGLGTIVRRASLPLIVFIALIRPCFAADTLTLDALVTPSTVIQKDGHPVTFAIHGLIEFKSLSEVFPYINSQQHRWTPEALPRNTDQIFLGRELLRHAIESRVVSMSDERPMELLITHTAEELNRALAAVKEPVPEGYSGAFLEVQEKWKRSLNCWSASPSIAGRVLSNWYPIDEGIQLYGATYDSTEHFWQAVKYHPDVTVGQLNDLLVELQHTDWTEWLKDLDDDASTYIPNAYAVEFLRYNLKPERVQWFRDQLGGHGLQTSDHARQVQQRGSVHFRFTAFEEKVLWGDLADLFHLLYYFSLADEPIRASLTERHFDAVYLGDQHIDFIGPEFRSLMLEIWKVKYLQIPRFREVISSIPTQIRLEHFLNDGDSPDIPIPVYVQYLNQIRELAIAAGGKAPRKITKPRPSGTT